MKEQINKNQFLIISLTLFSMFFGAGNFIFPPMLGRDAGTSVYATTMFFCLTAVALPILGISATAGARSLKSLVNRVDPVFGLIFTVSLYLVIGPCFAIPRAANTPYEVAIAPFVSEAIKAEALFAYSLAYFCINYFICSNKNTMINTLGKFLTPTMLVLICVLFIAAVCVGLGEFSMPSGKYAEHAISSGFLEGYQTMDALASLVFAIIVIDAIKSIGIKSDRAISMATIKAGILAGAILMAIYMMLAHIGASSGEMFKDAENGAALLSSITNHLFGGYGIVILGATFFLACLTTTVGLLSSISEYSHTLIPKISYKQWLIIWCVISMAVANVGLTALLTYSVPALFILYPVAIVLIILGLLNPLIQGSKLIYRSCVYLAVILGITNSLDSLQANLEIPNIKIPFLTDFVSSFPFYDVSLGWIVPEIVCFALTYAIYILSKNKI